LLRALLEGMRPKQWAKNLLVFAGLLFTLDRTHHSSEFLRVGLAFVVFCLLSGSVYLINDVADAPADRRHPRKRSRPVASGRLPASVALAVAIGIVPAVLAFSFPFISKRFTGVALIYFLVTLAYTFHLKHVVIIDVMSVAAGFILRAVAGTIVIQVPSTQWLLVCTGLLALFVALGKRRAEFVSVAAKTAAAAPGQTGETRRILTQYSLPLLDQMTTIVATSCLLSYLLYTFASDTGQRHPYLMATSPFVLYGLFRYLYLSLQEGKGETPEEVLVKDGPMLLNILLWVVAVAIALRL
jgi:4-hydroxybenzoate polyprenyltransferase and related prenyltransferases